MNPLLPLCAVVVSLLAACASSPTVARCERYCSSHDEGYQWARNAVLLDPAACKGYSAEFERGCRDEVNDFLLSLSPRSDGF